MNSTQQGKGDAEKQATTCGKCGQHKHTPWRDNQYGYVCLSCLAEGFATRDRLAARVEELELQLTALGDFAVADWDSPIVGEVDALVKEPTKYKDRLKALFITIPQERNRLAAEVAELKQRDEQWQAKYAQAMETWSADGVHRDAEENNQLRADLAAVRAQVEELKQRRNSLDILHSGKCAQLAALTTENEALRKERDALQKQVAMDTECIERILKEFRSLDAFYEHLHK